MLNIGINIQMYIYIYTQSLCLSLLSILFLRLGCFKCGKIREIIRVFVFRETTKNISVTDGPDLSVFLNYIFYFNFRKKKNLGEFAF